MKVLLISSYLPFPLYSGGSVRLYNIIKKLSEIHDITLICEKRKNQTAEDVQELKKICKKVITVDRGRQWSLGNIIKSSFSNKSFLVVGHTHPEMRQVIMDELVRDIYDIIHIETFYVMQNLPKVNIPIVLIEHNIEYLVYEKYAKNAKSFIKPLLNLDIAKIRRQEEESWQKANRLVAVSNFERKIMKREDVEVVPNGVDLEKFNFRDFNQMGEEKRILFIGDFKWMQNRDALETILKDIWPDIRRISESLNFNVKLWVVGKNLPQKFKKYNENDIFFDEANEDETWNIYRKAYILLAPLRIAGGTSYKILEAMASGVAVVTTDLGLEGLEAKNEIHALSGDISIMSDLVEKLLKDSSIYKKLTINARKFVEEKYDWKIIANKLNSVYMSCLE